MVLRWSIVCVAVLASLASGADKPWPPPEGVPLTPWAKEVTLDRPVLPEYPRPQLVRDAWLNLNGPWDYAITPRDAAAPAAYAGKILVPFPVQSVLSQVNKKIDDTSRLWYHRTFDVPPGWAGQRVLLHFGAVDWETHVILNGHELGTHRGNYDAFSFDITDALQPAGPQELVVSAWNPVEHGGEPRGKQALRGGLIFYTPSTGIWQTVWLEPVPPAHITALRLVPDVDHRQLQLTVAASAPAPDQRVEARISAAGREVARATGKPGQVLTIAIPHAQLWWPQTPFLYDLTVTLSQKKFLGSTTLDRVGSYFGLRKISVGPDEKGVTRLLLNNTFVFQNGFLDQGFWPDGLYTAPTDAALRSDIAITRQLGFNMVRKHIKVEPERWYYWADKLGLLVWQDMPASPELGFSMHKEFIPDRAGQYEAELRRMVTGRFNHPSIVLWVTFNEGWGLTLKSKTAPGEPDSPADESRPRIERMVNAVRQEDPTRLIDAESGTGGGGSETLWDFGFGDIVDHHMYGHKAKTVQWSF